MGENEKSLIFYTKDGKNFYDKISTKSIEIETDTPEECVFGIDLAAGRDLSCEFKVNFSKAQIRHAIFGKWGSNNWRKLHKIPLIKSRR